MALSFLKKATNRGAQEVASWSAKTYKFVFANETNGSARVLLEEDPEGVVKLEEWKVGDGIPIVGKAEKRHSRRVRELKKSILATSKPFQEFVLIRDQLKTVHMRSPVCKCSIAINEWNGSLKIVEIQRQVAETETFIVHPGYTRSPGYCTLRADLLEHALRAVGLQLGFELKDDESEMSDSISSKRASVDVTSWTASTSSDPVEAPLKSPQKLPAGNGGSSKSTRTPTFNELYAMHAIPEGQPSSVGAGPDPEQLPRQLPAVAEEPQEATQPRAAPASPKGPDAGLPQGFLPMSGPVLLHCSRRWLPARLAGISIGTTAVQGCVYVEFTDPVGRTRQQMILPDQIPRMLRKV